MCFKVFILRGKYGRDGKRYKLVFGLQPDWPIAQLVNLFFAHEETNINNKALQECVVAQPAQVSLSLSGLVLHSFLLKEFYYSDLEEL